MGIVGLMTAAGVGDGIEAVLKRRLQEREMARLEAAQAADIERTRVQDAWQRQVWQAQQDRINTLDQRQNDADTLSRFTESHAPGDPVMASQPEVKTIRGLSPGLLKAVPAMVEGDEPTVYNYQGTAAQRQQAIANKRMAEQLGLSERIANLSEARLDESERHNRVMESRPASLGVRTIKTVGDDDSPVTRMVGLDGSVIAEWPSAPTAELVNKDASRKRIGPVLQSIAELSERINTGKGAIAKISGMAERANAQLNLNDDVAEYESIVLGFTPMVARALGHTGVLTEQDVASARGIFPKPEDSKSLRDRKLKRLKQLLGAESLDINPSVPAPAPEPGKPAPAPEPGKPDTPQPSPGAVVEWERDPNTGKLVKKVRRD